MSDKIRINVVSKVDNKTIRDDVINGRKVKIVPSATMPGDIIMNGVKYPTAVIQASHMSLDRSPAPCGHPKLGGQYLSARDPEAINHFHIGAWNANVRWEGNRVLLDKIIDVEIAQQSEQGRRVLNAITKGEPISTSTGLIAEVEAVQNADHKQLAKAVVFDHDAILLDEQPAAAPEQGVGMLVNGQQIPVMNYDLDGAMREMDYAGQEMIRSLQRAADATLWAKVRDKVMAVIKETLGMSPTDTETETSATTEDNTMSAEELKKLQEGHTALETKVNELTETIKNAGLDGIGKTLTAMNASIEAIVKSKKKDDEEAAAKAKEEDVKEVVKANLMTEDEAKAADALVVNTLAKKAREINAQQPNAAPILRGAMQVNAKDKTSVADHFV